MNKVWWISREILIILGISLVLVAVSYLGGYATIWEYMPKRPGGQPPPIVIEKGLMASVIAYQLVLGIYSYHKLWEKIINIREPVAAFVLPTLWYWIFNGQVVAIFFLVLLLITIITVYRIRSLVRSAHDIRKTDRFEHGRDHTLPI